jgi:hypothetical protein
MYVSPSRTARFFRGRLADARPVDDCAWLFLLKADGCDVQTLVTGWGSRRAGSPARGIRQMRLDHGLLHQRLSSTELVVSMFACDKQVKPIFRPGRLFSDAAWTDDSS